MINSFYTEDELKQLGFAKIGKDVLISRKASIYGANKIQIGNNVRIDDFCVLSGRITIGNYVHIAVYSALFGGDTGIEMRDFSGLSSRGVIYAESDIYSGDRLTNPTVPDIYRGVEAGKVMLGKHVLVGSGCTILPGVSIGEGSAIGSMSLVNKSVDSWGIYVGIPCKFLKERGKNLLDLEQKLITECKGEVK